MCLISPRLIHKKANTQAEVFKTAGKGQSLKIQTQSEAHKVYTYAGTLMQINEKDLATRGMNEMKDLNTLGGEDNRTQV